jgi:hypothetical protein
MWQSAQTLQGVLQQQRGVANLLVRELRIVGHDERLTRPGSAVSSSPRSACRTYAVTPAFAKSTRAVTRARAGTRYGPQAV